MLVRHVIETLLDEPHLLLIKHTGVAHLLMAGSVGSFHQNHGSNIQLLEKGTVAHRVRDWSYGIVFSEQPIVIGDIFQVKLIEKERQWAGSLVSIITFVLTYIILEYNT